MPTFGRAGVYTSEQLIGPQPTGVALNPSTVGFIGEHWRGPTTPQLCRSWTDFQRIYGGFNTGTVPSLTNPYLPYAVYQYFANGGQAAYVARIAATTPPGVSAAVTLGDSAATPQNTLSLTTGYLGVSGSVGTWGNQLYVDVVNRGGPGSGRFDLWLYYGANSVANLVERWIDLSMNKSDARYAPVIMNSTVSGSVWVVATDLNSATASPNNAPKPTVVVGQQPAGATATQFSGGVDTGSPSSADRVAAMTGVAFGGTAPFDQVPDVLNINMPGETSVTVLNQGITYCASQRPYSFLAIDTASGLTPAAAVSFAQSLSPLSSYGAVFYPWMNALDPSSSNTQATRLQPPGGFVYGKVVQTDRSFGVWRAPAGTSTVFSNVVATERNFSTADLDTLNNNNVNAIRTRPNGQTIIWGTRTLQTGYASLYVPIRRTLNYIEAALASLSSFAVFAPNNSTLWAQLATEALAFLSGMWSSGAFPSTIQSNAFYVTCDSSNNTPQSISQGIVNMTVGVALTYPAEFINITVSQYQSTGQTTVTSGLV